MTVLHTYIPHLHATLAVHHIDVLADAAQATKKEEEKKRKEKKKIRDHFSMELPRLLLRLSPCRIDSSRQSAETGESCNVVLSSMQPTTYFRLTARSHGGGGRFIHTARLVIDRFRFRSYMPSQSNGFEGNRQHPQSSRDEIRG